MSYAKQETTVDRLMKETLGAFDLHISGAAINLQAKWEATRQELKAVIMREYGAHFPGGEWNLSKAKSSGCLIRIKKSTRTILENFLGSIAHDFKKRKHAIYSESLKRYSWVMAQVTPENTKLKVPTARRFHESAVTVYAGSEWAERMGVWLGAYHQSLQNNIALGAANASSIMDAAGEVDDTKAGSPSSTIFDALRRIMEVEMWSSAMEGEDEFYGANSENLGLVEVWKTRYGADVCEDCDANEGLTMEECDGDIPMHPNCRCFWRLVPASFKDLLMRGDNDSRALAYEIDARGLVPDSLVMRGPNGSIVGKTIVSFEQYESGRPSLMVGMN